MANRSNRTPNGSDSYRIIKHRPVMFRLKSRLESEAETNLVSTFWQLHHVIPMRPKESYEWGDVSLRSLLIPKGELENNFEYLCS